MNNIRISNRSGLRVREDLMLRCSWSVSVDDSTQYATIYCTSNGSMRPVATLNRARVMDHDEPAWRLYDTSGVEIGDGVNGPWLAMHRLNRIARDMLAVAC